MKVKIFFDWEDVKDDSFAKDLSHEEAGLPHEDILVLDDAEYQGMTEAEINNELNLNLDTKIAEAYGHGVVGFGFTIIEMPKAEKGIYWDHEGMHQSYVETINSYIPSKGSVEDTFLELFRTASNVYYDLYNNGLGNAQIKLPPFLDHLENILRSQKHIFDDIDDMDAFKGNVRVIEEFWNDYKKAEDEGRYMYCEDSEDEEYIEGLYPEPSTCEEPMEHIMDSIILICAKQLDLEHQPCSNMAP